jgi:hypothetical protein
MDQGFTHSHVSDIKQSPIPFDWNRAMESSRPDIQRSWQAEQPASPTVVSAKFGNRRIKTKSYFFAAIDEQDQQADEKKPSALFDPFSDSAAGTSTRKRKRPLKIGNLKPTGPESSRRAT